MSASIWYWLARTTCPRHLYHGPRWLRRLSWWWLQWWGWAFFYSEPWKPGSVSEDSA